MSFTLKEDPHKRSRCQALDLDGKQCRKRADMESNYHGGDLYQLSETKPGWVRIKLCIAHRIDK